MLKIDISIRELENKMRCGQKQFYCILLSVILICVSSNSVFAKNAKEEWLHSSKETKDGARLAFALGAGEIEEQNLSAEEKSDLQHLKTLFPERYQESYRSGAAHRRHSKSG